jgi:hypothetical protein
MRHTLPAYRQAGLHRDNLLAKVPGPCPVLASGNMPSRQAGSLAETAHRAVSIRSAIFIAGPLGVMPSPI